VSNDLRARIALANLHHRCAACFAALPGKHSPAQEATAREEGRAQGMTEEQLNDPTYAAKICNECWEKHGGLGEFIARSKK
jgi:hypothetical protein